MPYSSYDVPIEAIKGSKEKNVLWQMRITPLKKTHCWKIVLIASSKTDPRKSTPRKIILRKSMYIIMAIVLVIITDFLSDSSQIQHHT